MTKRKPLKNNSGFTLGEALIVVAIMCILMAIAVPAIFSIQKKLRQKELDTKAETIYMAVQNRLIEMYTSGHGDSYDPSVIFQPEQQFSEWPGDYNKDSKSQLNKDSVWYFTSETANSQLIVNDQVMDQELLGGHWVIEYVPYAYNAGDGNSSLEDLKSTSTLTSPMVYAVYYSEKKINVAEDYSNSSESPYFQAYRFKKNRLNDSHARVGYYGGSNVGSGSETSSLSVNVSMDSDAEIMTAKADIFKPGSITADMLVSFELSDGKSNSYTILCRQRNHKISYFIDDGRGNEYPYSRAGSIISCKNVGQNYTFTLILDNLQSESTRFYNIFGEGSQHNSENSCNYTNRELLSGSQLTLKVTASCTQNKTSDNDYTVSDASDSVTGNSLFSGESTADTAYIKCGRHLQNLDESTSHLTKDIIKAEQKANISFAEDSEWQTAYGSLYFNGQTTINRLTGSKNVSTANFKPISNPNLIQFAGNLEESTSYSISNLTIFTKDSAAGLFNLSNHSTLLLTRIFAKGFHIYSESKEAGALVGMVDESSSLSMDGCQSFLSKDNGDIPSTINPEDKIEKHVWINGNNAGGLLGLNAGITGMRNSSASTVVSGQTSGGLIGRNTNEVNLEMSYSDSYLYGNYIGGLIGRSTNTAIVSLQSCYCAGYAILNSERSIAAGFLYGKVAKASHCYTLLAPYQKSKDGGIDQNKPVKNVELGNYYSSFVSVEEAKKIFYFNAGTDKNHDIENDNISAIHDKTALQLQEELGDSSGFIIDTKGTQPYKLMGQSLTTYTYPRITSLTHYGDWEAIFQEGALVYYEKYKDENGKIYYGFEGANLISTLTTEDQLLGDGYGIIFQKNGSKASKVEIYLEEDRIMTISPTTDQTDIELEGSDDIAYKIYPLSKETVNPQQAVEDYYQRVTISQSSKDSDQETSLYFDFNPHFARSVLEVISRDEEKSLIPNMISIRSPRHLYDLSLYYDDGYREITQYRIYKQERNLIYSSYDWKSFSRESHILAEENPIGASKEKSFCNTYDGSSYTIQDISFISKHGQYIGLFGYISEDANIKNVVIAADYKIDEDDQNYGVERIDAVKENEKAYIGILAGYNEGKISNCAVAGYVFSPYDGALHSYQGASLYCGGFVAYNAGTIRNSSADGPKLTLSLYRSTCYIGGFTGINKGNIQNCYALNQINAITVGKAFIAGFTANNEGSIRESYCATALTVSGDGAKTYAFSPNDQGLVLASYYLHTGSYQFVDGLYSYDLDRSQSAAMNRTYAQLVHMNSRKAQSSYFHNNTTALSAKEKKYPYRCVVTDHDGNPVHYGEWQTEPELGSLGLFYWEHESTGENQGYKITYVGQDEGTSVYKSTLCNSHDDGGRVTEYGYGYYVKEGDEGEVSNKLTGIVYSGSTYNGEAASHYKSQIPGYSFFPYTTAKEGESSDGSYIYLSTDSQQGSWEISYKGNKTKYNLTPFFANAMQIVEVAGENPKGEYKIKDYAGHITSYRKEAGKEGNPYEIRSMAQLQYLNWNSSTKTCNQWLSFDDYRTNNYGKWSKFNYLSYATGSTKPVHGNLDVMQSHDLDGNMKSFKNGGTESFTPIGSFCDVASNATSSVSAVYFNGSYDGNNYTIKNIEIVSKSQSVGLFGVTIDATIKNVILYSENNNYIRTSSNSKPSYEVDQNRNWYCLGGLVGAAMMGSSNSSVEFNNCCVSGYNILDERDIPGYGGTNIGGFAGMANVPLENCSAVTEILISPNYSNSSRNIRVGGVVGNYRGQTLSNCYAGGSINTLYRTSNTSEGKSNQSTIIHMAGLVGGYFMRTAGNLQTIFGTLTTAPAIKNCYTYVDMSQASINAASKNIYTIRPIYSSADVSSSATVSNCYYYSPKAVSAWKYDSRSNCLDNGAINISYEQISGKANLTAGSYSGKNIVTALNAGNSSPWATVTTKDASGITVNGKYSFPGADKALIGKNYPFPTVLKQTDITFHNQVNVHYGAWPKANAYWEEANASMNLFTDLDLNHSDEYGELWAYKTFRFLPNGDSKLKHNLTVEDFEFSSEGVVEITDITKEPSGEYHITIKALNAESVTITEKQTGADFLLEIKAEFQVKIYEYDKQTMELGEEIYTVVLGEKESMNLCMKATSMEGDQDLSTLANLTWTPTVSNKNIESGDAAVERLSASDESQKNLYRISSYGYNANINMEATYIYHGNAYSANNTFVLQRSGIIGLSDGHSYNEAKVKKDTGISSIMGEDYDNSSATRPEMENGDFFLYDTEAAYYDFNNQEEASFLTKYMNASEEERANMLTVLASSESLGADAEFRINISTAMNYLEENDFRTISGLIRYVSKDKASETVDDVHLTVIFTNANGITYQLELNNLKVKPIKPVNITLIQNIPGQDGEIVEEAGLALDDKGELIKDQDGNYVENLYTIPECPESFLKNRYTFTGWNSKEDGSGNSYTIHDQMTFDDNTNLYAQWDVEKYTLTLDGNGGVIYGEDEDDYSFDLLCKPEDKVDLCQFKDSTDSETIHRSHRLGYKLLGWSTKKDTSQIEYGLNQVLDDKDITKDMTIYAIWDAAYYELELVSGLNSNVWSDQTVSIQRDADHVSEDSNYRLPSRMGWTLDGWYTKENGLGTKILNADGSFSTTAEDYLNKEGTGIQLADQDNNHLILYAAWSNTFESKFIQSEESSFLDGYEYVFLINGRNATEKEAYAFGTNFMEACQIHIETRDRSSIWYDSDGMRMDYNATKAEYLTQIPSQCIWNYVIKNGRGLLRSSEGNYLSLTTKEKGESVLTTYSEDSQAAKWTFTEDGYLMTEYQGKTYFLGWNKKDRYVLSESKANISPMELYERKRTKISLTSHIIRVWASVDAKDPIAEISYDMIRQGDFSNLMTKLAEACHTSNLPQGWKFDGIHVKLSQDSNLQLVDDKGDLVNGSAAQNICSQIEELSYSNGQYRLLGNLDLYVYYKGSYLDADNSQITVYSYKFPQNPLTDSLNNVQIDDSAKQNSFTEDQPSNTRNQNASMGEEDVSDENMKGN